MSLTRRDLLQFLRHAAHPFHQLRGPSAPIYVLGNPSADLDSIISAILYSYFASSSPAGRSRQYVPLINLPGVRSGKELWRLRPEFATALRLATTTAADRSEENRTEPEDDAFPENTILTIADFKELLDAKKEAECRQKDAGGQDPVDVLMVDWNGMPLTPDGGKSKDGMPSGSYEGVPMTISGCIDHHQDESFIPPPTEEHSSNLNEPLCIQTGVGSCTSLVVRELRSRAMWDNSTQQQRESSEAADTDVDSRLLTRHEAQAAKLALAAILADTANMTAESKVSDIDRAAVSFLERKIMSSMSGNDADDEWDRQSFYEEIMHAKENSVETLTMEEILGRDYKEWTEMSQTNSPVKIGFCNVVKPLSWILRKTGHQSVPDTLSAQSDRLGPYERLFAHLSAFSRARDLDIVVLMTVFTGPAPEKEFKRELLIWDLNDVYRLELQRFETVAAKEFGLSPWRPDDHHGADANATASGLETALSDMCGSGYRGVWKQNEVSKSRKQVAPLVRDALSGNLP